MYRKTLLFHDRKTSMIIVSTPSRSHKHKPYAFLLPRKLSNHLPNPSPQNHHMFLFPSFHKDHYHHHHPYLPPSKIPNPSTTSTPTPPQHPAQPLPQPSLHQPPHPETSPRSHSASDSPPPPSHSTRRTLHPPPPSAQPGPTPSHLLAQPSSRSQSRSQHLPWTTSPWRSQWKRWRSRWREWGRARCRCPGRWCC